MPHSIADLAQSLDVKPGHAMYVLDELGVEHDGAAFDAEKDTLALVEESLLDYAGSKTVPIRHGATPRQVADALALAPNDVQKTLITKHKIMATATTALKDEQIEKLFESYGFVADLNAKPKPKKTAGPTGPIKGEQIRPPVVTIMGHVDHGKTSLLDYIRKANVAAKEHGGITQHIGAYQVQGPEGLITFLDTPGHAAFTSMRARGAQVTDIAILVVAADDGIMPTTIEAIQHAKNANVPIIVAVNKIDKENANPDRVMQQLPQYDLVPEAYGGQTITTPVSALTGQGVDDLLELIGLQAEVMELKADPKGTLQGSVVEAKLDKGRGPVATILVQNGTLKMGDAIVVGNTFGRVKAMTDYLGQKLTEAGPSTPVEVLGLSDVPGAGDKIEYFPDERSAREVAVTRAQEERDATYVVRARGLTLRGLREKLREEGLKKLNLVIKADVQGSVEAVRGMLEKVKNEEVEAQIILSGVGGVTKADIDLAAASEAIVVGFNVKPDGEARKEAEKRGVEIRTYNIIYELIEDIEKAAKGMLEPKFEEQHLGTVEIRVRFQFSKKGIIAGSYVTEGKVTRNAQCRVTRAKQQVYAGKVSTLRHLKDDVREVTLGMECGLTFDDWTDFQEGDIVEAYEMVQVNQ